MTPKFLAKIASLVQEGATIVGSPPLKSPSLSGYPECDPAVQTLARKLWGGQEVPTSVTQHAYGKGRIFWGGECSTLCCKEVSSQSPSAALYPSYESTVAILRKMKVPSDFAATGPVRYTHRRTPDQEIYFVSNKTDQPLEVDCTFRVAEGQPELWDPVRGETGRLPQYQCTEGRTVVPMQFAAYQSFFVVFPRVASSPPERGHEEGAQGVVLGENANGLRTGNGVNFPNRKSIATLAGPWKVAFNPQQGGPAKVTFAVLEDWTRRTERGIRYYSGIATYRKSFDLPTGVGVDSEIILDLGTVCDLARVRINGQELPVVWTAPWQVNLTHRVRAQGNRLEIEVANRWPNRLIGDQQPPDAEVRTMSWPSGLLAGKEFKTGRYTFTVVPTYDKQSPLLPSGLLGPVRILQKVAQSHGSD
jgi:hypothetical protein